MVFKTYSTEGRGCPAILGAITAVTLLLVMLQHQGFKGTAIVLQKDFTAEFDMDRLNATLESVVQAIQLASADKALTPLAEVPAPAKNRSHWEDASLCSRLGSVFAKPPPLIDLPLYEDSQNSQDPAAFVRLKLANATVAAEGHTRSYSIYVYDSKDVVADHILYAGGFEPQVYMNLLKELYRFAKENGLSNDQVYFVDIGGHIGSMSLPIAAHGFRVIAFEPMFYNQMALSLSICTNEGMADRVTVIRKGLGSEPSECTIFSLKENIGNGYMRCGQAAAAETEGERRGTISIGRLDEELQATFPQLKGRLGAVKLDVEGYEGLVLQGASKFMAELTPPFVVAECDDRMMAMASGKPSGSRDFLGKMSELGYSISVQKQDASVTEEVPASAIGSFSCGNLATAFFKKGRPSAAA